MVAQNVVVWCDLYGGIMKLYGQIFFVVWPWVSPVPENGQPKKLTEGSNIYWGAGGASEMSTFFCCSYNPWVYIRNQSLKFLRAKGKYLVSCSSKRKHQTWIAFGTSKITSHQKRIKKKHWLVSMWVFRFSWLFIPPACSQSMMSNGLSASFGTLLSSKKRRRRVRKKRSRWRFLWAYYLIGISWIIWSYITMHLT